MLKCHFRAPILKFLLCSSPSWNPYGIPVCALDTCPLAKFSTLNLTVSLATHLSGGHCFYLPVNNKSTELSVNVAFMIICGIFIFLWHLVYNEILIDHDPWEIVYFLDFLDVSGPQNMVFPLGIVNNC